MRIDSLFLENRCQCVIFETIRLPASLVTVQFNLIKRLRECPVGDVVGVDVPHFQWIPDNGAERQLIEQRHCPIRQASLRAATACAVARERVIAAVRVVGRRQSIEFQHCVIQKEEIVLRLLLNWIVETT